MPGPSSAHADDAPARRREYEWSDPAAIARDAPRTPGLEFLESMAAGRSDQPPIGATLGFRLVEAAAGRVRLIADPAEFLSNALGTTHGGVVATWADTAMGYAIQSRLPAGKTLTTLDIQVRYLRPVRLDSGCITIVGEAEHVGRRTAVSTARITDERDKLVATASCTCLILDA